jgi:hypothetical protein
LKYQKRRRLPVTPRMLVRQVAILSISVIAVGKGCTG